MQGSWVQVTRQPRGIMVCWTRSRLCAGRVRTSQPSAAIRYGSPCLARAPELPVSTCSRCLTTPRATGGATPPKVKKNLSHHWSLMGSSCLFKYVCSTEGGVTDVVQKLNIDSISLPTCVFQCVVLCFQWDLVFSCREKLLFLCLTASITLYTAKEKTLQRWNKLLQACLVWMHLFGWIKIFYFARRERQCIQTWWIFKKM